MNRVILMGRLTRDPEVRYSQGERSMAIARYTLAVDRRGRRSQDGNSEQTADFINCVAFDRAGEFAEKYFRQGMRVLVSGRIQTGSYVNKDGQKVYTTEVILDDQEFADSKGAASDMGGYGQSGYGQSAPSQRPAPTSAIGDGVMNNPDRGAAGTELRTKDFHSTRPGFFTVNNKGGQHQWHLTRLKDQRALR